MTAHPMTKQEREARKNSFTKEQAWLYENLWNTLEVYFDGMAVCEMHEAIWVLEDEMADMSVEEDEEIEFGEIVSRWDEE